MPGTYFRTANKEELEPGEKKKVLVNGYPILLVNLEGELYALDEACLHQGGPLSEGSLEGEFILCPWHHWLTSAKTGKVVYPPIDGRVATYPVRLTEGWVEVGFPAKRKRYIAEKDATRYGAKAG